ncbi:50S ribosomal protein L18 [Candidatus Uhrbacteria bacterium]|nr:50S ribosomal protein L18 [Candidatus Uhrbacteria bacterium]
MKIKNPQKLKKAKLRRRHLRVRAGIYGTKDMPRLSVFRSAKHVAAQIIDDTAGRTLTQANDMELQAPVESKERKGKIAKSFAVGKLLAERAKAAGIVKVVFDRGGRLYHGRIKALADGAREGGLIF